MSCQMSVWFRIHRHRSLEEPVGHGEWLVAVLEDDPGNIPAGLCPLLLSRVDNTKERHKLLQRQVSTHTLLKPGALTSQGYFAWSLSPADSRRINSLVLTRLTDISKGKAAQEELPREEVWGTAGCVGCITQHHGSCQQTGREHISLLSSFPFALLLLSL